MAFKPPTWEELPIGYHGAAQDTKRQLPTGTWRSFRPVVDVDECIQCGTCVGFCPDGVITLADVGVEIDYNFCKGCGVCANECPVKAIEMVREGE